MAQSPQQRSPGVFSRIGSWLLWGWGSPQPSGDVPSPETQEETPDEDNSETESPSAPTAVKVTDHSPVPAERSPTLTRNAKHLISISAGGEGSGESSRGHRSQVYLEETSEDSDSDIYNIRRYKSRTEPDVTFSPQLTSDLADRRESDTMGRRKSGKRRRSSHGDGGGAKTKSPTTSQPSSPATTSLARSPETAWAESAFEAAPKTVPECLRGEPPNSPGAARYESTVQSEWTERHPSDTSELWSSPESTDPDMDEKTVVRLTETPESKRRSLKVSHSEKFFTKKVLVTSKPHTEEQHESLKGAGDAADSELVKADEGARCSENIGTVKMKPKVGRIADKISLFENQASSSTNPRCLDGSPARNVTGHFRQFTEPAGTRSGTAPQKQLIKERAQNFTIGRKGGEKFTVQSGSSGVSGRTLNGGHLKTEKSAVKTDTSREKPEIKPKPSLNTDQTDSNSYSATVSTLFESTRVENKAMERANCYLSTVSSPSETQQVKSPTRTGSRSKKRRSKDTVQPLSPTSRNKQEIDLDKQEVKDINSYSMPSKPLKDAKTTEKYLKINSDKVTISHFPNEKPEELMRADTDTKMLTFPQTDAKEMKSEEIENKSSCFKPKTVTSTSETQASPPSGSTEKNSKTEEQTQPKHSETQEQKTNSNKSPAVQQSSERHRRESLKNRDMTVNTLFAEPAKPDPSVTDEEKPLSPEDLKEAHSKYPRKPANNSSRIDVMRNRESETDIKVIPEKDTARARRTTECVPKSEEEQELKPNHKSVEKDKNNVTKTLDQNTELIKNNNDRVTCTPVKQDREREMSKQSEPKETSAGRHDVIKTSQRKKTETTKKDTSTPPPASSEEKTTPPPASSKEKPTPPPASSELKTTPPPASSEEKTTPPRASSEEKTTPPPASSEEKTTPPPASSELKTTPPPASSKEKPPPASSKLKPTPPPASSELKTTPPPASSEEKTTPPPASNKKKVTSPQASSNEKATPLLASASDKSQTSISLMKPQSSDLATRRKEFIRKPLILPQITSAPGHVSLNRDSPSSWLDVERPVRRKQSIPDPKPKLNSSASETNLLEASRQFDPDDFISNVKRLAMPFTLPQRKHKQNRLQAPPFAMPSIREDRNEKPFNLEEFQVGLRRRREFMLDLIPTRSQNSEMTEKDDKPKRVNPERESILTRSVLFKRAKIEQQEEKKEEEKESDESKTEPVPVRSRLERCSILSGLRNPKKTRRKELLSPTDVLLSPTDAPSSPSQPRPTLDSPKQDISCTQTDDQVHLKPDEPKITPDLKPPVADLQPPPPSCQQIAHGPVMTPDPKTTPADSTVATVTEADAPPPLPSFDDIKLPGYLEKFLTKEPEMVQTSDGTDSTVSSESISEPAVEDLNKTVDVQTTNNVPLIPPANVSAACGFHRRPGKMVIYQQHQFSGQSFEFYRDETDATHLQLSSVISVKVIRGCWILFEKAGFEGRCIALEEEDIVELPNEWAEEAGQTSVPFVIGSVRLAVRDYTPPRIELFSELKGRGRCSEYVDDTAEVCAFGLPQNTGSIKVHSGLWMVYSDPGFQGLLAVLEAGEYPCPESWGFPVPAVGSLKALRMGGLKVQNPNAVKAVLYEKAGLQGRCVEVQTDVFSFTQTDRESDGHGLSSVSSLKILRGLWVGYDQEGFDGQQYVLEEGEYLDWRDWAGTGQNLLSLRPVLTDFSSPHIKMFSDLDFSDRGVNIDLLEPLENTAITDYSPQTRSVNVLSGAWVVFEEAGFSGQHYVIERGLYSCPEDWGSSSSRILSVIPVILDNQSSSQFKIQLFSEPDFCGSSILLEDSLPTMPQGFTMSSCRVITGSWLAFRCEGLSGSQCVLEEGDYPDVRMMGFTQPNTSVLSLQPAGHEFSLPSIVLFERSGFRGRRTVLKSSSVNLQLTESCTRVSSILVEGGIWILYEANNFRGSQFLLKPGEVPDWPKLSTWTRIGSLRPLIQKQVHFRLRNKEAGLLMSVVGSLGDLMRIQATEETGGVDQIWMYQDGHLQCKLLASCYVDVSSGVLMASSRAVLSSDPDKPTQLWNITSDGLIRNNAALNLVLEVKGGQQFDKTQIILNEFHPNKLNQRWTLELL